jgi:hypothetical protein
MGVKPIEVGPRLGDPEAQRSHVSIELFRLKDVPQL